MSSRVNPCPTVWMGQIRLERVLGHGAYGRVYYGYDGSHKQEYAVKCIPKTNRHFEEELHIHSSIPSHPHILDYITFDEDNDYLYLVLQYHAGGDLLEAIRNGVLYRNDRLIRKLFLQLLDAVNHLHRQKVFHCDIKPNNIICASSYADVYLADFGLATRARQNNRAKRGTLRYMSPGMCIIVLLLVGSSQAITEYARPSVASDSSAEDQTDSSNAARRSDIWSLGVTLLEMITGKYLWTEASLTDARFAAYMADPDYLCRELHVSADASDLFRKIFTQDPESRITLSALRKAIASIVTFYAEDVVDLSDVFATKAFPTPVHGRDVRLNIRKLFSTPQKVTKCLRPRRIRQELSISSDEGYCHDILDDHDDELESPIPTETPAWGVADKSTDEPRIPIPSSRVAASVTRPLCQISICHQHQIRLHWYAPILQLRQTQISRVEVPLRLNPDLQNQSSK
jgi:serine/threonine protein kinase